MQPGVPPGRNGITLRQRQILEELSKLAPELGTLYLGALRIISDANPARVYFVAHAVREIANRLPEYLDIPISKRVEYVNRLDDLTPRWQTATQRQGSKVLQIVSGVLPQDSVPLSQGGEVSIPLNLFRDLDQLFADHIASRQNRREVVKRLMRCMDADASITLESHLEPVVEQWIEITRWFVGSVHLRGPGRNPPDFQECLEKFRIFEDALYALVCPFYRAVEELDAILEETNRRTS